MKRASLQTASFAAPGNRFATDSQPLQRPLAARAIGLVRLIGDGNDLDDLSVELATSARDIADKARKELAWLVKLERGYTIGDTVREYPGGPRFKVAGFQIPDAGRLVAVVLRQLMSSGEPSAVVRMRPLDTRLEVLVAAEPAPA